MFNDMLIGVGSQLELQLTFCYMVINVKPEFMAMSLSVAPSRKLAAKSRLYYSTHALLQ
jgi:hypothetical protein